MLRSTIVVAILALALAASLGAQSGSVDLPTGPMQQKARTACMECHDANIIVQQRLDRQTWTKEIEKMMRWGAVVDPKDKDALADYFSSNFGTDKPAWTPVTSKGSKAGK